MLDMSIDKYISEAVKSISIPKDKKNRVNQAEVLDEAEKILNALYNQKLCLFIESQADVEFFHQQLATAIASIFPRKKDKKPPKPPKNKVQVAAGKEKWKEFGINFYRTVEFNKFSAATKKAYRENWKKIYPYYAYDDATEKAHRDPGGVRHFRTKAFKKSKKENPEYEKEYRGRYGEETPIDEFSYQVFLREHHTHQGPVSFNYRKGADIKKVAAEDD